MRCQDPHDVDDPKHTVCPLWLSSFDPTAVGLLNANQNWLWFGFRFHKRRGDRRDHMSGPLTGNLIFGAYVTAPRTPATITDPADGRKKSECFWFTRRLICSSKSRNVFLDKPTRTWWQVRVDLLGEIYLQHADINTSIHVTADHIYCH